MDRIDDGWEHADLSVRQKAALSFADSYLAGDGPMDDETRRAFEAEFSASERDELGVGLALFHGFSKVLIALGCEPDEMAVTELPTPGSAA